MITLPLLLSAWASPEAAVEGDWVVMRLALDVPVSAVRKAIDTAAEVVALGGERRLLSVRDEGTCELAEIETPGMSSPLTYTVRRCPVADGFREELVASEDFRANETIWSLRETATGTEIEYRVLVDPDLPAPSFLVTSRVKSAMASTLDDLHARVTAR